MVCCFGTLSVGRRRRSAMNLLRVYILFWHKNRRTTVLCICTAADDECNIHRASSSSSSLNSGWLTKQLLQGGLEYYDLLTANHSGTDDGGGRIISLRRCGQPEASTFSFFCDQ